MLPSKSMMEYMSEMHRLFPGNDSEDLQTPFSLNFDQPSFQSTTVNRSSSSTDSTSPESYPDLCFQANYYRPNRNPTLQDTPLITRPQRAIVGRKILGNSQQTSRLMSSGEGSERDYNFWQPEELLSVTPPGNTIPSKNVFYELFPSDNKAFEFKTPNKSEAKVFDVSPNFLDRSPLCNSPIHRNFTKSPVPNQYYRPRTSHQTAPISLPSPSWSNSSMGSINPSQRQHHFMNDMSNSRYGFKYQNMGAHSSNDEIAPAKMCTFCRKNGETPVVYMTHSVKEQVGSKNVVTCPILRSHVCATCGASGDNAHTITYCPVLRSHNNGKPLQSTTITLKNTRIKSNGRRRY